MSRYKIYMALTTLLLGVSGCSGTNDDLRQWMSEERRKAVPRVTPLKEPKPYVPQVYLERSARDPFNAIRLTEVFQQEVGVDNASSKLIAPELLRRKEPLEAYPLDTMSMVGSLLREGKRVALISADKLIYQVQAGNHLGQNYGLVKNISENQIELREIVQDTTGEWVERNTVLQLQEKSK